MTVQSTRWALFIRTEGRDAAEFFEIRRNGSSILSTSGLPFTMGESELKILPTEHEASVLWKELCEIHEKQSFECIHEGTYFPGDFNFDALQKVIEEGAREAF